MQPFATVAKQLIVTYKDVLVRQLGRAKATEKIKVLNLKRVALRNMSDVMLYEKTQEILQELQEHVEHTSNKKCKWYFGLREFYIHFKHTVDQYKLYNNTVIHGTQAASSALLRLLQIIEMTPKVANSSTMEKDIKQDSEIVVRFGSSAQRAQLTKMLMAYSDRESAEI